MAKKILLFLVVFEYVLCEDFNNLLPDGSYSFGYNNPDSYHHSQANRNNVVRGEFASRNPGTGAVDSIQYTAGPRGFRPRGKNVVRKYDFNQVRTRPVGSPNDPFFDPSEDPSYNFAFNTRTYNRQEASNRVGDVTGKYSYLDDVGERHNVEFIAGKNTGFHVRSAVPDNRALPFSPLQYVGKRKPVPRGRSTVQRGLDGSYRFVSGGPDHRRTETSDSTGHVRGSYTYLDDKGVRHSVHYIAGPETGYRVLKNVKGPHLPTIFPFGSPDIIPPNFYEYPNIEDVFDTAASGHVKPQNGFKPSNGDAFGSGSDSSSSGDTVFDNFGKPGGTGGFDLNAGGSGKPDSGGNKPSRPSYEDDGLDVGDIFGNPLGGGGGSGDSSVKPFPEDGSYKPSGEDGSYRPSGNDGAYRPGSGGLKPDSFNPTGADDVFRPSPGGPKPGPFNPSGGDDVFRPSPGGFKPSGSADDVFRPGSSDFKPGGGDDDVFRPGSSGFKPGSGGDDRFRPGSSGFKPGSGSDDVFRPGLSGFKPTGGGVKPGVDDGSYRPDGSRPSGTKPSGTGSNFGGSGYDDYSNEVNNFDLFDAGGGTGRPGVGGAGRPGVGGASRPSSESGDDSYIEITPGSGGYNDRGTLVTNLGDKLFSVPPGVSVRAHVQAIDLLPLSPRSLSPGDQLKAETNDIKAENSITNERVEKNVEVNKNFTTTTSTTIEKSE